MTAAKWEQVDLFAPKPKAAPLPTLTAEVLAEYRAAATAGEDFNSGAMRQVLGRLDAAEALLGDLLDAYEQPTPHAERARLFERVRAHLGR